MLKRDINRQMTIRLDPDSYERLKLLAGKKDIGVYTLARRLLAVAIDDEYDLASLPPPAPWAVELTRRTHDELVELLADLNHQGQR